MAMRVCICATQIAFAHGGAEIHVESLRRQLVERGFDTDVVSLPFSPATRTGLLKSALSWRLLELEAGDTRPIDLVIATRFPSYLVRHRNKVVWLIHQHRQAYDLHGTRYASYGDDAEDREIVARIHEMDNRTLREARALFANAQNTADRLRRYNDLEATALHPPPKLSGRLHAGPYGDYLFAVGRLDRLKRFDMLIRAMAETSTAARCIIAGTGPERERLQGMIDEAGLADRVELVGWVSDEQLIELYAGCFAVYYGPYDEDYGYGTIEAFQASRPVITAEDSGGVLEFVIEGENGHVCAPDAPRPMARRIDELFADRERARRMGEAGCRAVAHIEWDHVIHSLTGRLRGDTADE